MTLLFSSLAALESGVITTRRGEVSKRMMTTNSCCAECGKEEGTGGVNLKTCKSCMIVKYCGAACQRNHWATHKKTCKQRAAEIRDEALFKDPPPKKDCPICFLPMPTTLISCVSLPPATRLSVPIYDFAIANEGLANKNMELLYPCCGKRICRGACTLSVRLITMISALFVIPTEDAKQMKKWLQK